MKVVDVHAHLVPQQLLDAIERGATDVAQLRPAEGSVSVEVQGAKPTRALKPKLIDLGQRRAWMDEQGVDVQLVGTWADVFGYHLPPDVGVPWAELVTRTLLEATEGDDRFRVLASLPMQDPQRAADALAAAVRAGAVGAMIGTRVGDVELDDPRFEPVWEQAAQLDVPLLLHPGFGEDPRLAGMGLMNAVGRGNDTTIAGARILLGGVLERHEQLKLVLSHGGAALPVLLGRLGRTHTITDGTSDPTLGFARLYFDSVVLDAGTLAHLCCVASPGHVLLGSDYPFPIGDLQPQRVVERADLADDVKQGIKTGGDGLFAARAVS